MANGGDADSEPVPQLATSRASARTPTRAFRMSDPPQSQSYQHTQPSLAVVRFHGRRTETWEAKGIPVVERFRYLSDADELGEWVPRVREAASQVKNLHLLMNNCYAN